ncbi:Scr1 family TA system antitoxin-like transcriptional regulator [Streptomyces caatingaensis]|nr:Scr1 family TA system antitoxin-like transcriptional regulator [Streptomyces caatingaensis]
MRAWHSQVISGLLQTESYARALFIGQACGAEDRGRVSSSTSP